MAPRIVSWRDNEICIPPVLSSASSIVSFDSTFSYPSLMPPTTPRPPELHGADPGAKQTSTSGFSDRGKIHSCQHATTDDSFIRHDTYFFNDGNVTFLVCGTLYCVHRYFLSRDSVYFSTRFAQLGIRDHEALPTIISIDDVERKDFDALLSVLYPANFEAHPLTYEQWKSVLHLSTRWGFASLRKLALKSIEPPTPHDQLVLARKYSVEDWVLPALTALCERAFPLGLDEAREMSMEDVILVATVREEIRGGTIRTKATAIPHHIEMVQAGKLNHPVDNNVYWNRAKSRSTGQESHLTLVSAVDPNVEVEDAKTIAVASPLGDRFAYSVPASNRAGSTQMHGNGPDFAPAPSPVPADTPASSPYPGKPAFVGSPAPSPYPKKPTFADAPAPMPYPKNPAIADAPVPSPYPEKPTFADVPAPSPFFEKPTFADVPAPSPYPGKPTIVGIPAPSPYPDNPTIADVPTPLPYPENLIIAGVPAPSPYPDNPPISGVPAPSPCLETPTSEDVSVLCSKRLKSKKRSVLDSKKKKSVPAPSPYPETPTFADAPTPSPCQVQPTSPI